MLNDVLRTLFKRELEKLRKELDTYSDEKYIWIIEKNIANSAGNLCLHLVGNLSTYIGKELGNSAYVRNRELEFSQKDVPRATLVRMINETIETVDRTLAELTEETIKANYPAKVFDHPMTTEFFLIHLIAHFTYHLGQVNYHRRLLDKTS